jgi:hypothetical protein
MCREIHHIYFTEKFNSTVKEKHINIWICRAIFLVDPFVWPKWLNLARLYTFSLSSYSATLCSLLVRYWSFDKEFSESTCMQRRPFDFGLPLGLWVIFAASRLSTLCRSHETRSLVTSPGFTLYVQAGRGCIADDFCLSFLNLSDHVTFVVRASAPTRVKEIVVLSTISWSRIIYPFLDLVISSYFVVRASSEIKKLGRTFNCCDLARINDNLVTFFRQMIWLYWLTNMGTSAKRNWNTREQRIIYTHPPNRNSMTQTLWSPWFT